ncbi:MAG: hypothetical protein ACRDNY_04170 [Gaiellaceae bacterium]
MDGFADRLPVPAWTVRAALVVFVLAWIFGPRELRSAVPIWVVFAIALGLELNFLFGALRSSHSRRPDRAPQVADRERFGYDDTRELLLVREGDEELWIPYSGETEEELDGLIAEAREWPPEEDAGPPAAREPRGVWLPVRGFLTGVGIVGALALVAWVVESRTGWNAVDGDARAAAVERFSGEASRIAGRPVTIRCDESRDYVGFVQHADGVAIVGGDRAYVTPEICHDLYRLAFEGETTSSQTARALAVLAHEAWHLRGVRDEGTTECYALQSAVELGRRLGLSEDSARRMMRQQLVENALRSGASVEYRVPPDCRDGGRLDLHPGVDGFP